MHGPQIIPTQLVLVRGTPSKRAVNKSEPKPPQGCLQFRSILTNMKSSGSGASVNSWVAQGVISKLNGIAFELLIATCVEWRKHCDLIDQVGETYNVTNMAADTLVKAYL